MNTSIDDPRRLSSGTIVTTTEHRSDDYTVAFNTFTPVDGDSHTIMNVHPKGDCATEVLIDTEDGRTVTVGDINIFMTFEQFEEFRFAIERG